MQARSAVEFAGASRVHVALEVRDLWASIAFYRALFEREPVKVRGDYAKFEPASPPLNLSLNLLPAGAERPARRQGDQHFGIQVKSSSEVERVRARLEAAGLATRVEQATACCYAVQDKVWVTDPDGNPWEVFVVLADSETRSPGAAQPGCCVPATSSVPSGGACC